MSLLKNGFVLVVLTLIPSVGYSYATMRDEPEDAEGFVTRSIGLAVKGEYDKAIKDCDEALRLDPKYVPAFIVRGNLWASKKDYEKALKDFNEGIQLSPEYPPLFAMRGSVWASKKDYEKALKDFDEAIRLDPKAANTFVKRGNAMFYKKDYERAIKDFDEAIRLDSKHIEAHDSLAWLLSTRSDPKYRDGKKALAAAKRACELTEWKSPFSLDNFAAACAENALFDEAIKWEEKALADPDFEKRFGDEARQRLKLYREKKPFRED